MGPEVVMANYQFSDLDLQIIDILKRDGRASNQKIATDLGVTTSVVATRIRRMSKAKAMKIIAVTDFSAFDYNVLLPIGVDVKGRSASDVAEDLALIDNVASVQLCAGKHAIELLVTLSNIDELPDLLLNRLSKVKGVRMLDPAIAVDIVKYDFDVAPI